MTFMLADTSVIPAVPSINAEPEYEVTIDIDELFVNKFIKAKNALPDAKNFAVQVQNGKIKFIIKTLFDMTTLNDRSKSICTNSKSLVYSWSMPSASMRPSSTNF